MEREKQNHIFTQQEIERHLQSALAAETPDLWPCLKEAIHSGQLNAQALEEKKAGEKKGKTTRIFGRLPVGAQLARFGAVAAACICIFAAGGWYHYAYIQIASQVEIDVNPSLKFSLNRKERVVQVQALNEDGERLAGGASLKGKTVQAAVNQVVDSLVEQGYLKKDGKEHAVLVSVSGKSPALAEQVKAAVTVDMEAALTQREVKAVVYDQVIQVTEELEELAEAYQVSLGKAEFIGQLVQENVSLSQNQQEAYSRMMSQTMEELSVEIDRNSYQVGSGVTVVKTEQEEAFGWERSDSFAEERDKDEDSGGLSQEGEERREAPVKQQEREPAGEAKTAESIENQDLKNFFRKPGLKAPDDRDDWEKEENGRTAMPKDGEGQSPEPKEGIKESEPEEQGSGSEARRRPEEETQESEETPVQVQGKLDDVQVPAGDFPEKDEPETELPSEEDQTEGEPETELPSEEDQTEGEPETELPSGENQTEGEPETELPSEEGQTEGEPEAELPFEENQTEGEPEAELPSEENQTEGEPEAELPSEESQTEGEPETEAEEGEQEEKAEKEAETESEGKPTAQEETEKLPEDETEEAPKPEAEAEEKPEAEEAPKPEAEAGKKPETEAEAEESLEGKEEVVPEGKLKEKDEPNALPEGITEEVPEAIVEGKEETPALETEGKSKGNKGTGEEKPESSRIIRTHEDEADTFEPGDMAGGQRDGQAVTSNGTQIIFEAVEEKRWEEPVYASQLLTGSELSLLQMGPGMFFGQFPLEDQKGFLPLGPGFSCLYGTKLTDLEDEPYLWGVRLWPFKGHIYCVGKAKEDKQTEK